jgi:assimilatory nitrate reductase catalytic subunit
MIVCHCFRVSDREIRNCVREGACNVGEVGQVCDAGMACGGCRPEIARIVDTEGVPQPRFELLPVLQTG